MIKAKKKFGQNFLVDESVKSKIIQAMPNDSLPIVEIGPGLGDLTQKLLQSGKLVSAFEIDLELCDVLKRKFEKEIASGQLTLVCKDVLDVWKDKTLLDKEYHLVANLPYYVATNIILKALHDTKCRTILVMVQKEVAKKFEARANDREFSSLAILANSIANVEVLFDVGADSFVPPPKVTSSVLRLIKEKEFVDSGKKGIFDTQEELVEFEKFLRIAFRAPRKTLSKNLSSEYDKSSILKLLQDLDLMPSVRPHQLSIDKYHLLFKKLK